MAGFFVTRSCMGAVGLFWSLVRAIARGFIQHFGCSVSYTAEGRCFFLDNIGHPAGGLMYPFLGFRVIPKLLYGALSLTGRLFCLCPTFTVTEEIADAYTDTQRSEEHTSELQSRG